MLTGMVMPTSINNRTTIIGRVLMNYFIQEMRISNFSAKTIMSYLYYNRGLILFTSKFSYELNQ